MKLVNITSRDIKKAVSEMLDSLCERNGFDDWWYNLDDDIQKEIEDDLFNRLDRRVNEIDTKQKKG